MRNSAVDSLRGLSILAVLLYHFRPFASPAFTYGLYGVLLFFMISGYCMTASLEASGSLRHFLAKRWARLMPALVVCGFLSTVIEKALATRPDRLHGWSDWLASSVCLPTANLPCLFLRVGYIHPDGAYWTLAVEFLFYFAIGITFWLGGLRAFSWLVLIAPLAYLWNQSPSWMGNEIIPFLPAFLIGVGIYKRHWPTVAMAIASLILLWLLNVNPEALPISWPAYAVCAALLYSARWIDLRLAWLGVIAYPLYLLHQDIGLALLALIGDGPMQKALVCAALIGLALAVNRLVEYRFQRKIVLLLAGSISITDPRRNRSLQ